MKRVIRKILLIILLVTTTNLSIPLNVFAENTSYPYSGTCGDNITWTFDENGVLNIRGSGDMHSLREIIGEHMYHPL